MFETLRLAYLNILHLVLNAIVRSSNCNCKPQYISNLEFWDVSNRIQVQIWVSSDLSVAWVRSRDNLTTKRSIRWGWKGLVGISRVKREDVINRGVMFVGPRWKYLSVKGSPSWPRASPRILQFDRRCNDGAPPMIDSLLKLWTDIRACLKLPLDIVPIESIAVSTQWQTGVLHE